MAIFDFLPEKHDKRWLLVFFIIIAFTMGILYSSTRFILKTDVQMPQILWMLMYSTVIAAVISLLGYFFAKVWFVSTALGLFFGLAMLVLIFMDYGKNGWEDLIGVMSFIMVTGIGFIVGGVGELIAFVIRKTRAERQ